tara:strand:+ start:222 stop:413 length:192 start_codon:yes stop_codon:yes gene_type:complete
MVCSQSNNYNSVTVHVIKTFLSSVPIKQLLTDLVKTVSPLMVAQKGLNLKPSVSGGNFDSVSL